jgi:glyoxylase-like metal-dependent hydrolase (beta-lactamase superfamily II)
MDRDPGKIDFIIASHFHFDHCGGNEFVPNATDGTAAGVRKVKISMSDKRQALMDLAKIARLLPADRHELSGPGGGAIEVKPEHKIDLASLEPEQRDQLRQVLLALKAKQIEAETP